MKKEEIEEMMKLQEKFEKNCEKIASYFNRFNEDYNFIDNWEIDFVEHIAVGRGSNSCRGEWEDYCVAFDIKFLTYTEEELEDYTNSKIEEIKKKREEEAKKLQERKDELDRKKYEELKKKFEGV